MRPGDMDFAVPPTYSGHREGRSQGATPMKLARMSVAGVDVQTAEADMPARDPVEPDQENHAGRGDRAVAVLSRTRRP